MQTNEHFESFEFTVTEEMTKPMTPRLDYIKKEYFSSTLPPPNTNQGTITTAITPTNDASNNGTSSSSLDKSVLEEYQNYSQCILWLKLHGMITSFLMLWSLASKSIPQELLATKFLHVLAPFLTLHWWHLTNYPIHTYMIMRRRDEIIHGFHEKESPFWERMKLRVWEGTLFAMLLYISILIIDLLYFCIRLAPLASKCFSKDDGSGNTLPLECRSDGDGTTSDAQNKTLFAISFFVSIIHLVFGLVVILVIFKTRSRVNKSKLL